MKIYRSLGFCLLLSFLAFACFNPEKYQLQPDKIPSIIRLDDPTAESMPADGSSLIEIQAVIDANTADNRSSVVFKTTAGSFVNGKGDSVVVTAQIADYGNNSQGKIATALLKSSLHVGEATVSVKYGSIAAVQTKPVKFVKAYPSRIRIDSSAFFVKAAFASVVNLSAQVGREKGMPSVNNIVRFSATDSLNRAIGVFRSLDSTTNAEGRASVLFGVRDSTYLGNVKLVALSVDEKGATLAKDSVYVQVFK